MMYMNAFSQLIVQMDQPAVLKREVEAAGRGDGGWQDTPAAWCPIGVRMSGEEHYSLLLEEPVLAHLETFSSPHEGHIS